jgi:hypothetical protein
MEFYRLVHDYSPLPLDSILKRAGIVASELTKDPWYNDPKFDQITEAELITHLNASKNPIIQGQIKFIYNPYSMDELAQAILYKLFPSRKPQGFNWNAEQTRMFKGHKGYKQKKELLEKRRQPKLHVKPDVVSSRAVAVIPNSIQIARGRRLSAARNQVAQNL